jgi:DnaJ like chaperone protein
MGKWIGALFGWLFAGPFGLLLGFYIGHLFDKNRHSAMHFERMHSFSPWTGSTVQTQAIFFESTFQMLGYIAKSDGRVSEKEISFARTIMQKMSLNQEQSLKAMRYFNEGKTDGFDSDVVLQAFAKFCKGHRPLIQMFLEIQLQGGLIEGRIADNTYQILRRCCVYCEVPPFWIDHIAARVHAEQGFEEFFGYNARGQRRRHSHRQDSQGPQSRRHSAHGRQSAYQLLGVKADASVSEVKKAYRKLMSEHHPDKLAAKGLPPEMMKLATEKTQQIRNAYETVMEAKGEKV